MDLKSTLDFYKDRLEHDQQKLADSREWLTEAEIAEDELLIQRNSQRIQELEQMDEATWEAEQKLDKKTHQDFVDMRDTQDKLWRTQYREQCKKWCQQHRPYLEREYRIQKGQMEQQKPREKTCACPRCHRPYPFQFKYRGVTTGHMMSSTVYYRFKDNIWHVFTGYGSIIADCDKHVVVNHAKMGALLRQDVTFCDLCLVDLVEEGTLRIVYLQDDAVVDPILDRKLRYGAAEEDDIDS